MAELNPQYVMRKISIDKESIKDFIVDVDNRRKIRGGHVKNLLKALNSDTHFNAPFVVNEKNGKYRLLDGNHRLDAVKLKVGQDKFFSIGVWCAVYRNLTENQEREVYKIWNSPVPQSATDFLKAYWKTLPFGKEILKKLPVAIYGERYKMASKNLIGAHINAKKQRRFEGGYGVGKEETISDFSNITSEDIDTVKEFCDIVKEIFGSYDSKFNSLFYKTNALPAFYRIWFDNRQMPKKNFISIFKKIFTSNPNIWENPINASGRVGCILFYELAMKNLNNLQKRYLFLSDELLVPQKEKEREIISLVKKN